METNQFGQQTTSNNDAGGVPPSSVAPQTPKKDSKIGPIAGIVIVVIVLVIGALYFWGQRLNREELLNNDPIVKNLQTQNTSDELSAIEDDLSATALDGIGTDLDGIGF